MNNLTYLFILIIVGIMGFIIGYMIKKIENLNNWKRGLVKIKMFIPYEDLSNKLFNQIKRVGLIKMKCSKCKNKSLNNYDLCDKHIYFEIELNKIKNYLYETSKFDIGIIEHLKIEDY